MPQRDLFASRAERLRQLADGHPLAAYLLLIADLCEA
ncbi:formate dehydrogenase accessory protein FdhE domain-containing protein, partial [Metapseudomonas otitidis]